MTDPEASAEKQPRPDETLWSVALVLLGTMLDPEAVSRTLGLAPTKSWRTGDRYTTGRGTIVVRKHGLWRVSSPDAAGRRDEPSRISERILDLLSRLPFKGNIREALPDVERSRVTVFYARSLIEEGPGRAEFLINPAVSEELSRRGLELYLEVFLSEREGNEVAREPSQEP